MFITYGQHKHVCLELLQVNFWRWKSKFTEAEEPRHIVAVYCDPKAIASSVTGDVHLPKLGSPVQESGLQGLFNIENEELMEVHTSSEISKSEIVPLIEAKTIVLQATANKLNAKNRCSLSTSDAFWIG